MTESSVLYYSFCVFCVVDGLAVEKTNEPKVTSEWKAMNELKATSKRKVTDERKATERRQFVRHAHNTSSARTTRNVPLQSLPADIAHLRSPQAILMRMHRNPVLLFDRPSAVRPSTLARPIPSDWTTVGSLRARRRPDARVRREDSYIISAESEPEHSSFDGKELPQPDREVQPALPSREVQPALPASKVQELQPASETEQPSSSPPVVVKQLRNRRRRAPANVDNNNSLVVNGADSSSAANENEKPLLIDFISDPANITSKETDVDSVLSDTNTQQRSTTRTSRRLVFEKVVPEVVQPVVKNRRYVTERRLPLHESSV